ncbi:unnamed protein product [Polarella glacialis]|uniref:Glycosyl transferase CAP10 domain-containing protein n=1 Tax=Polarella glacialis TaxID=89957 RepID=A0A813GXD5_POLGL|nr:unnamed protein product [Polarella glacialis]
MQQAGSGLEHRRSTGMLVSLLETPLEAPAPRWMLQEIESDLSPWRGQQIARSDMDAMERQWGHVFCRFRVQGGQLSTCDPSTIEVLGKLGGRGSEPWGQFEAMSRAARLLLALGLLSEDSDFFVSVNIYDHAQMPVPVLTKARAVFAPGLLRVPSYELVGPLLDRIRIDLGPVMDWETKAPLLYWRGGMRSFNSCPCPSDMSVWPPAWSRFNMSRFLTTEEHSPGPGNCDDLCRGVCQMVDSSISEAERSGQRLQHCRCHRHITNRTTFEFANRVRLCELSRKHPALVDAKLSYVPPSYDGFVSDTCKDRDYTVEYSPFSDHAHFRYLMSTDGSTIDDTRVYWMLSTGSLVFKQITPLLPFGVPGLEPWRHFVPVREDLADLVAKVRWARRHDAECRAMAERARDFAARYFTEDQILHYILRAIQQYQSLLASP